jgi:hypothetical protein
MNEKKLPPRKAQIAPEQEDERARSVNSQFRQFFLLMHH